MKKLILMCCSILPLCLQMPYLHSAWRNSRLDHWDWLFYLAGIPAIVWAARKEKTNRCDWWALVLLIPMLFLSLTSKIHHINALAAASAVVFIFAAVWLIGSWHYAYRILPVTMLVLLGTPSSSYGISLLLMCPVWATWLIKFLLGVCCFGWIYCNKRFDLELKKGTLCFAAAILCSCFLLLHSREIYFEGRSFVPDFSGHPGDYWGRSIEPDDNTKRFFVSSIVKQYRYTRENTDISVLAVKCGSNIHEIHPASHCLRTSFWTINSEKILYLQDNFAVTEIDAEKGARRFLLWVWYSTDRFSTPGFLGFRRHFRSGGKHYTYQISTRIHKDVETSRMELQKFVQILKQQGNTAVMENKQ